MYPDSLCVICHVRTGDHLIHGSTWEGPGAGAGAFENLNVRGRGNAEGNTPHLNLALEHSAGNSGDLNLGVEQASKRIRIAAEHLCINVSPLGEYLQGGGANVRVRVLVGGANDTAHCDQYAVVLPADQLVKGSRHRLGQVAMADQRDAIA